MRGQASENQWKHEVTRHNHAVTHTPGQLRRLADTNDVLDQVAQAVLAALVNRLQELQGQRGPARRKPRAKPVLGNLHHLLVRTRPRVTDVEGFGLLEVASQTTKLIPTPTHPPTDARRK